ncbi:MAG: WD40 repeat domain-containing protein [Bacteroidetes bacterium]|nr:WD40 repeat domain-containing protein [Bacteroidota bacterium]
MKKYIIAIFIVLVQFQVYSQKNEIQPYKILEGHTYKINYLHFSNDGRYLASGGWDNYTILWDMENFSKLKTLKGHSDWVRELNITPNNKYVVSGSHDGTVNIYALNTGELKHVIKITPENFIKKGIYPEFDRRVKNAVCAVSFTPDGKYLLVGTLDEYIRIFDTSEFELINKLKAHHNGTGYIDFSKDGNLMVSGSIYKELIVWDTQTYLPKHILKEHRGYNSSFQLFNQDKYLVNAANDTINVWNVTNGELIRSIPAQDKLQSVQLTPDEKYMLTCGEDHMLILWDFESGKELWSYKNSKPELADCKISPNGELLALATPEGKILIWEIKDLVK